jgi:two-component system cell cycle sensor histidine kinase/response regulator CckA
VEVPTHGEARIGLRRHLLRHGGGSAPADDLAPRARAFLFAVMAAAAVAAVVAVSGQTPDLEDWLLFAGLGGAAALAERLLVPTGRHHGFPLSVVFLVAAALLLPPVLVGLMGLAQHVPDLVARRFPWYITAFNTANYTLSALAAWVAAELVWTTSLAGDLAWLVAGVAASVALVVVNHVNLAVMLRLARGRPLRFSGLLSPTGLLADLALASLGVVLAHFWLSEPYLLPLAIAPLFLIQRSFRLLARLGESEERFRTMFEGAPVGTVILDLERRIVSTNRVFEELVAYDKDELVGRRLADVSPEPEAASLEQLFGGAYAAYAGQRTLVRKDGAEVRGHVAASLVVDAQRRPQFVIVMVEDLTERLRLEEQLRHSQRLEAVGQLAGGVAHDFNNLLTIIAGRTRFALRELVGADDGLRTDLEEVAAATERAAALTRQLLAFSRRQVLQPRVLDLNAVVTRTDRMLRRLIGEDIEIAIELAEDLHPVRADRGQLEQVILNLAVNARDAMPNGGRLTISTSNVELGAPPAVDVDRPDAPGPHAMLAVSDTGHGMDAATRSHLFEPFFTTKEPGKGTGLGLSTVYGIVAQSGGHISVDSALGAGSTFSVYLPAVDAQVAAEEEPTRDEGTLTGAETVLLVEDDAGVRALAELVLSRHGYTVLTAGDGSEALGVAADHEGGIDVLLTDVVMPRMKGPELAEEVVRLRPGIRVVYMSGYTDAMELPEDAVGDVVPKPFSEEALVRKIRDALDATADEPKGAAAASARRH